MSILTNLSVLLVDDDEDTRELLEMVLDGQGATVRTAMCAEDARAVIRDHAPDVILTDINLPDEDGFAFVASLRADAATRDIPAIAVTGHSDREARTRAVEAGFQKFITKPFDVLALATAIAGVARAGRTSGPELDDARIAQLIAERDMRALLGALNAATPYRYTSIIRFVDRTLESVWTFDRTNQGVDTFAPDLPHTASYCSFVRAEGAHVGITDAMADDRAVGHAARESLRAYCGVPLVRSDGSFFGTLCHYDAQPQPLSSSVVGAMERVARLLTPTLSG